MTALSPFSMLREKMSPMRSYSTSGISVAHSLRTVMLYLSLLGK